MVWFRAIEEREVIFRIIVRDGDRIHQFAEALPIIDKVGSIVDYFKGRLGYQIAWSPRIVPPLNPGERLLYSVDVRTARTELDAFEPQGTSVGFPVSQFTLDAKLTAIAPQGFKFVRQERFLTVCDMISGETRSLRSGEELEVSLSPDGSVLSMHSEMPTVGAR